MKRLLFVLATLGAAVGAGPSGAESLVSTLSDAAVEITSSFTGEQIVVFGAVSGASDANPDYQVAVVVQGPDQDVIVRRKERVFGIWANRTAREFTAVPSYYVMHLSENFSAAADPAKLVEYRLGVESLPFIQEAAAERTAELFAKAAVDLKAAHGLYVERTGAVEFLAPDVFRTTFFLPSEIPTGDYTVRVYLFRGQALLGGQTQTLFVGKGGFSERIARSADDYPLAYGLACVVLAIFTGWFAGVIFRRP
jgi:uncharacterized protein (TIGR02186 family)